jgi:hypothetical protein
MLLFMGSLLTELLSLVLGTERSSRVTLKVAGRPMTDKEAGPVTWGVWMRKN